MKDIKALKLVARWYRNSRVGEFLKELDLTEGRGTGIPKMIRELKRNDSPMPVFHTDKDRTYLTIEFPIHPAFLEVVETQGFDKVADRVVEKVVGKVVGKLSANQQKIIDAIVTDSFVSARRLAELIGISHRKTQDNLARLKKLGFIKRVGAAKGGHWEVVKPKESKE